MYLYNIFSIPSFGLSNKIMSSTIFANRTAYLPGSSGALSMSNDAEIISNKTSNSSPNNTVPITSAPISSINVNNLVNQDVRNTSSPTFNEIVQSISGNQIVRYIPLINKINNASVVDILTTSILSGGGTFKLSLSAYG